LHRRRLFGAHLTRVATMMCGPLISARFFFLRERVWTIIRKINLSLETIARFVIWRVGFDLPLTTAGSARAKKRKARH